MTDKVQIDRGLLRRLIEAHTDVEYGITREDMLAACAALDAPQQEAVAVVMFFDETKRDWKIRAVDIAAMKAACRPDMTVPLYTHPAPSVPEGWQLVPKEPTWEMQDAPEVRIDAPCIGCGDTQVGHFDCVEIYKAMLSAAPKPPSVDDRKDAARYRWLRHGDNDDLVLKHCGLRWQDVFLPRNEKLDAAIDAAMSAQKGEKE